MMPMSIIIVVLRGYYLLKCDKAQCRSKEMPETKRYNSNPIDALAYNNYAGVQDFEQTTWTLSYRQTSLPC